MPTVGHERHDLVFRVLVVGASSDTFLAALPLDEGQLTGQDVQGWHPHFEFKGFGRDPWEKEEQGKRLEEYLPYVDALVVNDDYNAGAHYSSAATERLSRVLRPGKISIPTAVFGGPALAQEWETLAGVAPLVVVEPDAAQAMSVVKVLAKALLRSRMRSTPPPPGVVGA